MYEDEDLWPLKCPECGEEFTEKIGRLKTNLSAKCPGIKNPIGPIPCPMTVTVSAEELGLALAEAKAGRYDPFRNTWFGKEGP
jgi:hypothetical protein